VKFAKIPASAVPPEISAQTRATRLRFAADPGSAKASNSPSRIGRRSVREDAIVVLIASVTARGAR
jgi:hypothetical protein